MRQTVNKVGLLSLVLVLAPACTTMTAAEREAWEYSRIEFRHKFIEYREQCLASGGRINVQGPGGALNSDGIPRTRVWYYCS